MTINNSPSELVKMTEHAIESFIRDSLFNFNMATIQRLEEASFQMWKESTADLLDEISRMSTTLTSSCADESWWWDEDNAWERSKTDERADYSPIKDYKSVEQEPLQTDQLQEAIVKHLNVVKTDSSEDLADPVSEAEIGSRLFAEQLPLSCSTPKHPKLKRRRSTNDRYCTRSVATRKTSCDVRSGMHINEHITDNSNHDTLRSTKVTKQSLHTTYGLSNLKNHLISLLNSCLYSFVRTVLPISVSDTFCELIFNSET